MGIRNICQKKSVRIIDPPLVFPDTPSRDEYHAKRTKSAPPPPKRNSGVSWRWSRKQSKLQFVFSPVERSPQRRMQRYTQRFVEVHTGPQGLEQAKEQGRKGIKKAINSRHVRVSPFSSRRLPLVFPTATPLAPLCS